MVKVVWTESALSDLNDIGEFIGKDSVRYAKLIQKLVKRFRSLITIASANQVRKLPKHLERK